MTFLQAILFAIVQGVSELFPVSSLGHAVILPAVLGWHVDQDSPQFLPFLVVLHVGTATALLVYFWREWWGLLLALLGRGEAVAERSPSDRIARHRHAARGRARFCRLSIGCAICSGRRSRRHFF